MIEIICMKCGKSLYPIHYYKNKVGVAQAYVAYDCKDKNNPQLIGYICNTCHFEKIADDNLMKV